MKKYNNILHVIFIILIFTQSKSLFSQFIDESEKVKNQFEVVDKIKYGFYGGLNIPLSPEELTKIPKIYDKSSESLLNGLDGLGYKSTFIFGFQGKFNIYHNLWTGGNFAYSSWLSKNSCFIDSIPNVRSENSLSLFTFGLNSNYFIAKFLYLGLGIDLNLFSVNVKEIDSKREYIYFTQKYSRIGISLIIGADISLLKNMSFDVSMKAQFANLLGGTEDNPDTFISESIINSYGSTVESNIMFLQINFGIIFSSNK